MVNLNILKNMHNYDVIDINTDDGRFQISFENVQDLYWTYRPTISMYDCPDVKSFKITKENYYLYEALDELYSAIINDKPHSNCPFDYYGKDNKVPSYNSAKAIGLLVDNKIEWRSDDFDFDDASILSIEKVKDVFCITFQKSNSTGLHLTFAVRFRNDGSSYSPFNITFMNMYNKLKKYDYQMHIEEILYEQDKVKRLK